MEIAFGYQKHLYDLRKETLLQEIQSNNNNNEEKENSNKQNARKLIDSLILNESQFTEQEILDNINQFFLAGFETTANQMCHIILMVAMHSEYQEIAYQEIRSVFHSPDVEFTTKTIADLRYVDQIVKEAMRLYAVGPFILKTNSIDVEIQGKVIPKGTLILLPIHLLHRNGKVWGENALAFNPENFSPENVEKRHPYGYMPFSLGKRNCLGEKF